MTIPFYSSFVKGLLHQPNGNDTSILKAHDTSDIRKRHVIPSIYSYTSLSFFSEFSQMLTSMIQKFFDEHKKF